MKSFKDYLIESKQVYEFKVKIAGDCPKDCAAKIKEALAQFKVESCSGGKSTPIQERQQDFPDQKNVSMTVFDVCTCYPATSAQIRDAVSAKAGVSLSNVLVRNLKEQEEDAINHANDEKSGKAMLGTEYEASDNQDLIGGKRVMSFLKELSKTNNATGEVYDDANSELLAKSAPSEKVKDTKDKIGTVSAIGSKKTKLPSPLKGR